MVTNNSFAFLLSFFLSSVVVSALFHHHGLYPRGQDIYGKGQIPLLSSDIKTILSPNGAKVRYKEPGKKGICETTPGVNSYSGFIDTSPTSHFYFWFFESRNDPSNDPITMWINGGPGSDSLVGLFGGLGPCNVVDNTTEINPYSWNAVSNLLFLSQPIGTGFSYETIVPGYLEELTGGVIPTGEENATGAWPVIKEPPEVDTSERAAVAAWDIVQTFYSALPTMSPQVKSKKFHLWTQSWGGHYGPAFFKHFYDQNEKIVAGTTTGVQLELSTLGIGNGYIDALIQGPTLPSFAVNNTYNITAYNSTVHAYAQTALTMPQNGCLPRTRACRQLQMRYSRSTLRDWACGRAWGQCFDVQDLVTVLSARDRFDLREPRAGADGLSVYARLLLLVTEYLNRADVQDALGVASNYTSESAAVRQAFDRAGDGALGGFVEDLGFLLERGVGVAMFHGDADYSCNWVGGEAVSLALNYTGAEQFRSANYEPFLIDGKEYGLARQHGNFSFTRIYEAGHMVCVSQPRAALELFNRTVNGLDVATGSRPVRWALKSPNYA